MATDTDTTNTPPSTGSGRRGASTKPAASPPAAPPTPPDASGGVARPDLLDDTSLAASLEGMADSAGAAATRATMREAAARLRRPVRVASDAPSGEMPLFVEGTVHVMRDKKLHVIKGGVMVSETDLTAAEIDELTAMRVVRVATPAEMADAALRAKG